MEPNLINKGPTSCYLLIKLFNHRKSEKCPYSQLFWSVFSGIYVQDQKILISASAQVLDAITKVLNLSAARDATPRQRRRKDYKKAKH